MLHALRRGGRTALGLGQDEGALQCGLGVQRQAVGRPVGLRGVLRLGLRDGGHQRLRMGLDALGTGLAQSRVGGEGFLHHRAQQAGEFGRLALQQLRAEVDVGQQADPRVNGLLVGRLGEQRAGHRVPVRHRAQRQVVLGLEVVEEAALGDAGGGADVVHRGGVVALAADGLQRGAEQSGAGIDGCFWHEHTD